MNLSSENILKKNALLIRKNIIQAMIANRGGHIGGSLDLAEMLSVVYTDFMRIDKNNVKDVNRDFMIFSKGHAGPALYSSLALKSVIPEERLKNLNNPNSLLPGHCDRNKVPGVDATTGSLGQGLSIACGVALGSKLKKNNQRVFCVIGDGEAAEGQIWEAAQFAAHYKLDNLITFLDWNKLQIDGTNDEVMSLGDPIAKFKAFGWNAELVNGADVVQIQTAVKNLVENKNNKPSIIILDTIKGGNLKCVMEIKNNHCIGLSEELIQNIKRELNQQAEDLEMEIEQLWN